MQKTILIPCYNEKNFIETVLKNVKKNISEDDNIIIIDDGSNDGTTEILKKYENDKQIECIFNNTNLGKGSAIISGLNKSSKINDVVLIQDADLEYDPEDYKKVFLPFYETNADVVYGSRFLGGAKYYRLHFFWHLIANKILTLVCNLVTNLNMTDMETGYKCFKKDAILSINLREKSFGIEPEITVKLSKKKFKFFEVPISYNGRSYAEGKKIQLKDAFVAIYCIIKYRFFD
jgi:glycosyltransferase involved in cell wall biosynthesis|tara:strand:+ start:225 stop:923 length:699 start_codon:yes stop_codon:yes gene_type:complete